MANPAFLALLITVQVRPLDPAQVPRLQTLPAIAATAPLGPAADREDPLATDAMRGDARLNDVCFVDLRLGWAVGDRGTIWHTDDGGRSWQLQHSDSEPKTSSLRLGRISERSGDRSITSWRNHGLSGRLRSSKRTSID